MDLDSYSNNLLKRTLASADFPSLSEPPGLFRDDGKRPDGMTLGSWCKGKTLVWDVTCADTFAPSHLPSTSTSAGSAASSAQLLKHRKYTGLRGEFEFEAGFMARLTNSKTLASNNGQFQGNFFIHSSEGNEYCHERAMPSLRNDIQTAELGVGRGDEARPPAQLSRQYDSSCGQYSANSNHPFMRDSSGVEHWIDTGCSPSTLNAHTITHKSNYIHPSERSTGQADIDQMLLNDLLNDGEAQFDFASTISNPKQKDCSSQGDEIMANVTEKSTKQVDRHGRYFLDSTDPSKIKDVSNVEHATVIKDPNKQKKDTSYSKMRWTQNDNSTNLSSASYRPATNHNNKKILLNPPTTKLVRDISRGVQVVQESSNSSSSVCDLSKQEEIEKKAVKRNRKDLSARKKIIEKLSTKASNIVESEKLVVERARDNSTGRVPYAKKYKQHCRRYESGDYDDDSDLSVLTANYIRSTKVSKGNNNRQSKSFLRSVKVIDREASTKSLILHANKSTETSTDFALNSSGLQNPDVGPAGRTRASLYKNLHYKNEEVLVKAGLLKYTCSEDVHHIASQNPNQCLNVYPVSQLKCESDAKNLNYSYSRNDKNDLNSSNNTKLLGQHDHFTSDDTSSSVMVVERKSYNMNKSKERSNTKIVNMKKDQSNWGKNHHRAMCSVGCITDDTILINEKIMQATLDVQKKDIDNLIDITKNALKSLRKSGNNTNYNENCPQWSKNIDETKLQVSSHENRKLNKRKKSSSVREKSYALCYAASNDSDSIVNQNTSKSHGKSRVKQTAAQNCKQKQNKFFK